MDSIGNFLLIILVSSLVTLVVVGIVLASLRSGHLAHPLLNDNQAIHLQVNSIIADNNELRFSLSKTQMELSTVKQNLTHSEENNRTLLLTNSKILTEFERERNERILERESSNKKIEVLQSQIAALQSEIQKLKLATNKTTTPRINAAKLRENILEYFTETEIISLVDGMGVVWEEIPGRSYSDKAMELIRYIRRRTRLEEFIQALEAEREDVDWRV